MQLQQITQRKEDELVTNRRSHHQSSCMGAALAASQVIPEDIISTVKDNVHLPDSSCQLWKTRCFCLTLPVICERQYASACLFLSPFLMCRNTRLFLPTDEQEESLCCAVFLCFSGNGVKHESLSPHQMLRIITFVDYTAASVLNTTTSQHVNIVESVLSLRVSADARAYKHKWSEIDLRFGFSIWWCFHNCQSFNFI